MTENVERCTCLMIVPACRPDPGCPAHGSRGRGPDVGFAWIDEVTEFTLTPHQEEILRRVLTRIPTEGFWESTTADLRPSKDEFGMTLAKAYATRADCSRRKVGAVVIGPDGFERGGGYNGAPVGEPGCLSAGACPRAHSDVPEGSSYDTGPGRCISIHAEINAVLSAGGRDGCKGATMYVTADPCDGCAPIIRQAGIVRVVVGT